MSWRHRRGGGPRKRDNAGCVFCGAATERVIWLLGPGRQRVCEACKPPVKPAEGGAHGA